MLTPHFIHHAFILPAFLALLILLPTLHPRLPRPIAQILPHLALTLPILIAWNHTFGIPLLPPRALVNWLFYFCILACLIDILFTLLHPPPWLRFPIVILVLATLILFLSRPKIDFHWPLSQSIPFLTLLVTLAALIYLSFDRLARHATTHLTAALFITTTTLCLALSLGRSPAQLLVPAIAALPLTLAFTRRLAGAPGPLLLFTLLPLPPLLSALLYLDLPPAIALLLVSIPIVAWLTHTLTQALTRPRRLLLRTLASTLPSLAAIALSLA